MTEIYKGCGIRLGGFHKLRSIFTNSLKSKLKLILAFFLYYCGVVNFLEKIVFKNRCIVLAYHRIICPEQEEIPVQDGMYVRPKIFEGHVRYLNEKFNVLSLEEVLSIINKGGSFNRSCLITFDDGWKDTYTNAWPILKKYNMSATIFLVTDYIGTNRWFWPERVLYLLVKTNREQIEGEVDTETREVLKLFHCDSIQEEYKIKRVIEFLKKKPVEGIEHLIEDLKTLTGTRDLPNKRLLLDWNEVEEMGRGKIHFGSHSRTHAILARVFDRGQVESELVDSKDLIEGKTGKKVRSFCFPNGNSNGELERMVKNAGYECAFVGGRGTIGKECNLFQLKRIGIHNDVSYNIPLFACRILFGIF